MTLEKFHFTPSDGDEIVVPYMQDAIPYKKLRALRKKFKGDDQSEDLQDAMLDAALDKETKDRVENFSLRDYVGFVNGWGEADEDVSGK